MNQMDKKSDVTIPEYSNPWFSVFDRNGFFTVEYHTRQIAILIVVDSSHIVLVKVKRPVIAQNTWELPAGGSHNKELLSEAAAREMEEETGIKVKSDRLNLFGEFNACPNRFPEPISVFRADISSGEFALRASHDHEVAEVRLFSFVEVEKMIKQSEIFVTLPLAVLGRFLLDCHK